MNLKELSSIGLRAKYDEMDGKTFNLPDLETCCIAVQKNLIDSVFDGTKQFGLVRLAGYTVELEKTELVIATVTNNYKLWLIAEKSTGLLLTNLFVENLYTVSWMLNMHSEHFEEVALQIIELNPEAAETLRKLSSKIYEEVEK